MSEELKAAQARIACLEGEIAKRDEELAAFRVAVENCELFRARIAELEHRCGMYGLELTNEVERRLQAERQLSALKAQGVVMPDVNAAAKALCNRHAMICGVDADDQWKEYSQDFIADAETVLANARLNAAPAAPAADAGMVEALRKIMEAHRFNMSGMSVTEVHSICFDALAAHSAKGVV